MLREIYLIHLSVGSIADDLDELEYSSRILKTHKTFSRAVRTSRVYRTPIQRDTHFQRVQIDVVQRTVDARCQVVRHVQHVRPDNGWWTTTTTKTTDGTPPANSVPTNCSPLGRAPTDTTAAVNTLCGDRVRRCASRRYGRADVISTGSPRNQTPDDMSTTARTWPMALSRAAGAGRKNNKKKPRRPDRNRERVHSTRRFGGSFAVAGVSDVMASRKNETKGLHKKRRRKQQQQSGKSTPFPESRISAVCEWWRHPDGGAARARTSRRRPPPPLSERISIFDFGQID